MRMWFNSKYVNNGDIFLVNEKNKKYVKDAIKNKASKIVTELDEEFNIKTEKTDDIIKYFYEYYYDKIKDLKLIGITGTNGKTTTCYLIYQMLNMQGIKTSYIGTIGYYVGDTKVILNNTTPSMDVIYNLLLDSNIYGCKYTVMEVSSHALKQNRLYGLLFDAIGVTNITMDHLDYHKTMNDYINSKKKIVNMLRNKKICILNKKDKYYKEFINDKNNNHIIGKDIKIKKIINRLDKTILYIKENKNITRFNLSLIGKFNCYNYLMAYEIVKTLGYMNEVIINNSYLLKEPPGRMQLIKYNTNSIFVDYAHTPDAVLNVLKTVNKIKNKGVITIIGCGGNRDSGKRPIMAKVACKNSSYVIFTNDNPRYEDEQLIMKDMLKGAKDNYEVIYDRRSAIRKGISLLNKNMVLLILGKGHETYQIIGDTKYDFSDYKEVKKVIKKY